jgi:hypothetical protein
MCLKSLKRARKGLLSSKVMATLTALRQSCCHPQIVRSQDDLLGEVRHPYTDCEVTG